MSLTLLFFIPHVWNVGPTQSTPARPKLSSAFMCCSGCSALGLRWGWAGLQDALHTVFIFFFFLGLGKSELQACGKFNLKFPNVFENYIFYEGCKVDGVRPRKRVKRWTVRVGVAGTKKALTHGLDLNDASRRRNNKCQVNEYFIAWHQAASVRFLLPKLASHCVHCLILWPLGERTSACQRYTSWKN